MTGTMRKTPKPFPELQHLRPAVFAEVDMNAHI
jgi:hypothetical protein